jgi:hypothetical protein
LNEAGDLLVNLRFDLLSCIDKIVRENIIDVQDLSSFFLDLNKVHSSTFQFGETAFAFVFDKKFLYFRVDFTDDWVHAIYVL